MPIYEYECDECGNIEEALQKFSDKPLETCGACSGHLHKLVSKSSFHLKGTGWYVTDYPKESKKDSESPSDKKEASGSDAKEASASDPKEASDKSDKSDKKEAPTPKSKETSAPPAEKSEKKSTKAPI